GAIEWFVASELGQKIRATPDQDLLREIPFNLALPPEKFPNAGPSADPLDQVMLRGRIDLLIREDQAFTVVDYKTDNVTEAEIDARQDFYRPQVQLYRDAIQKLTGTPVTGVYLVFLAP